MEHLGQIMIRLGAGRRRAQRRWQWRSSPSQAATGATHPLLLPGGSRIEGDGLGDEETQGCELGGEEQIGEDGSPGVYGCVRCHGSGYLRADVPYGHPQFGKAQACVCTQERRKAQRRQFLLELSHLEALSEFREATFASFDALAPGVLEAYQAARDFASFPAGWLVLSGQNGCGKTHLAIAIAKQRLLKGDTVLVLVVPDLLDYLRTTFAPTAEVPYAELFGRMREADLLVLDDLGAQQNTAWANEKLFQLLNYRYNAHLPTVITTNSLDLSDLEPRIRSRVSDRRLVCLVTLTGAGDYRQGDTSYSHGLSETEEEREDGRIE